MILIYFVQCQRRYEELLKDALNSNALRGGTSLTSGAVTKSNRGESADSGDQRPSRPGSAKNKSKYSLDIFIRIIV